MNLGYEPEGLKIYLFRESVDMRKQMNGLIALVEGINANLKVSHF